MREALVLALAYLLGSIPFGYLAGRLRGVDIRASGSRNTGATNVFRTLGRGLGITVMAADILKGLAAVLIARALLDDPWPLAAAALAVAGHVFPVWLRFRGGKGVAVAAGVLIGVMPLVSLTLVAVWVAIVLTTRYVSVASIVCALALTPLAWLYGYDWPSLILAGVVSAAILVRHRANLIRLARGQELRIDLGRARRA
ncbi:MAG: acyl phosphate:glycerol-3-phosphate acyltransferase [Miltoncostaeaceae bacterium]|nr:acyl phosphate:glycerol-3-phosphate acyltransferase [Miltoncostaeaceae bacterium]